MNNKTHYFIAIATLFFTSCNNNQASKCDCEDFYKLNKNMVFKYINKINTTTRNDVKFNKIRNVYEITYYYISVYDSVKNNFFYLPIYPKNATIKTKNTLYDNIIKNNRIAIYNLFNKKNCDTLCTYINYVDNVNNEIARLRMPATCKYSLPEIKNHKNNNITVFTLDNTCICYYIEDSSILDDYWINKLKAFRKKDKNWYIEK